MEWASVLIPNVSERILYKEYCKKKLCNVYKSLILCEYKDWKIRILKTGFQLLTARTFPTNLFERYMQEDHKMIIADSHNLNERNYYTDLYTEFSNLVNRELKERTVVFSHYNTVFVFNRNLNDFDLRERFNEFIHGGLLLQLKFTPRMVVSLFQQYDELRFLDGETVLVKDRRELRETCEMGKRELDHVIDDAEGDLFIDRGAYPLVGTNIVYNYVDLGERSKLDGVEVFTQNEYSQFYEDSLIEVNGNWYSKYHLKRYIEKGGRTDPLTRRELPRLFPVTRDDETLRVVHREGHHHCYMGEREFWKIPMMDPISIDLMYVLFVKYESLLNGKNCSNPLFNFIPDAYAVFTAELRSEILEEELEYMIVSLERV